MTEEIQHAISPTETIIAEIKAGHMVVLVDEEDRENEGDLLMAAEFITPEKINFMAKHARGLICLTLTEDRCKTLGLTQMVQDNKAQYGTAFTVSIEAAKGVSTGISAADRARTVQVAVAKAASPTDIVQPGHIFPITARKGGVLVRAGHTEAGCDLAALAGAEPAAVICEIMNDDGTMARLPQLLDFAKQHDLKIGTIADLIHYRARAETLVEKVLSRPIETPNGPFTLHAYLDRANLAAHLVLQYGEIPKNQETLVRVHEPLSVVDFLDPTSKHGAFSIDEARAAVVRFGHGIIVLMHRAEDGQAVLERLSVNREKNTPSQKWDSRTYGIGAQILRDLGVGKMRLLSNPHKMPSMTGFGLEITGFIQSIADIPHPSL